jgi:serine/threonine protein kinase
MTSKSPELKTGTKIGRYECLQRLGFSAFGELWVLRFLADENSVLALGRVVRLEADWDDVFHEALSEAAWDSMEIQGERVVHPADVLFDQDLVLLVSDYVEGQSLRVLLQLKSATGTALPVDVVLRIVLDALTAIDAAHEGGELLGSARAYGGISPESLLIGTDGNTHFCDPLVGATLSGADLTKARVYYRAPEQVGAPGDARSDVFALGCLLWELLANHELPLDTRAPLSKTSSAVPPLDAKRRPPGDIPPTLVQAVSKATALVAKERFSSPKQMVRALEAAGARVAERAEVAAFVEFLASSHLHSQRQATESSTIASLATLLGPRRTSDRPVAKPPPRATSVDAKSSPSNPLPLGSPKPSANPASAASPPVAKPAPAASPAPVLEKPTPPAQLKSTPLNAAPTRPKSTPLNPVPVVSKTSPSAETKSEPLNAPPIAAKAAAVASLSAPVNPAPIARRAVPDSGANERPALSPLPTKAVEGKPAASKPANIAPKALTSPETKAATKSPGKVEEAEAAPRAKYRPKAQTLLGLNAKALAKAPPMAALPPAPAPPATAPTPGKLARPSTLMGLPPVGQLPQPAPAPIVAAAPAPAISPRAPVAPLVPPPAMAPMAARPAPMVVGVGGAGRPEAERNPPAAAALPELPALAPAPQFGAVSMLGFGQGSAMQPQTPASAAAQVSQSRAEAAADEEDLRELSAFVGERYSEYDAEGLDDEPTRADIRREDLMRRGGTIIIDGPNAQGPSSPAVPPSQAAEAPPGATVWMNPPAVPLAAPMPPGAPPPGHAPTFSQSPQAAPMNPSPGQVPPPTPANWGSTMQVMPPAEQAQPAQAWPPASEGYPNQYPGATLPLPGLPAPMQWQSAPMTAEAAPQAYGAPAPTGAVAAPGGEHTPVPVERAASAKGKMKAGAVIGFAAGAIAMVTVIVLAIKFWPSSSDSESDPQSPEAIAAALGTEAPAAGSDDPGAGGPAANDPALPAAGATLEAPTPSESAAVASALPSADVPPTVTAVAPAEPPPEEVAEGEPPTGEKPAAPRAPRATKPKKKKRFVPSEL